MKLPWKREPEDLVGGQVEELHQRDAAERRLTTPLSVQIGTSWADRASAGMLLIPEEVTFPTTAAGGWCAPSEVIYEMEQALRPSTHPASVVPLMVTIPAPPFEDGMLSLPEVGVRRGGTHWGQPARMPTPRRLPPPPEWLPPPPVFKDVTAP